jgi:hypothetical protein
MGDKGFTLVGLGFEGIDGAPQEASAEHLADGDDGR